MAFNLPERTLRDDDDNVLKRRLLGAAVLIALAVIILPLMLDGSGSESRWRRVEQLRQEPPRILDESAQVVIPDKEKIARPEPKEAETAETVADTIEQVTSAPQIEAANVVDSAEEDQAKTLAAEKIAQALGTDAPEQSNTSAAASSIEPTQATEPGQDDTSTWVIQIGSFTDEANALEARDELRTARFPAFVSDADSAGVAVFRVKVGPIVNRRRAESLQKEIESLLRQSTLIRQYP